MYVYFVCCSIQCSVNILTNNVDEFVTLHLSNTCVHVHYSLKLTFRKYPAMHTNYIISHFINIIIIYDTIPDLGLFRLRSQTTIPGVGIICSSFWWSRNRSRNRDDWNRNRSRNRGDWNQSWNRNQMTIPHIYVGLHGTT